MLDTWAISHLHHGGLMKQRILVEASAKFDPT